MIYVPTDNTYNKCYVVLSEGVIRGYDRVPSYNSNYNYRDYYISNDYIYRDGTGNWGSYSTLPVCLSSDVVTNNYWYRVDIFKVLIIFFIIFTICIRYPYRLFIRIFGRWLKV